ncbi:MAG: MBL fold metallo-hydrolase [Trueperaceae bacterium]|nr:MAG: MBL fold metallo-hydrolase [Trueperaceae bacterium]
MENCYLLSSKSSQQAVLVDPGEDASRLLGTLAKNRLTLEAIWLTHAHFDHVGALAEIVASIDVPVYLHPQDKPWLANAAIFAAQFGLSFAPVTVETIDLRDGQVLQIGDIVATCLHTPGHAPGHIAFHLADQKLVLAGDTLFRGSIGRTDLPGGNHDLLIESIRKKILTLPQETRVYPGHGPDTTVGIEIQSNPFLC